MGSSGRAGAEREYYLVAVTDVEPSQLADPAFLELLSTGGLRITLSEGEKKVQDLKLGK